MRVVKALDAGPMLAKAAQPIGHDETSDEVERALAQLGARLLVAASIELAGGPRRRDPAGRSAGHVRAPMTKEDGVDRLERSGAIGSTT